ncbi:MAG: hypothetical protein V3U18_09915 [Alphaproteobacteria bacterium]|jgi:excinuclease UvrABC nuclease subunit
MPLLAGKHPLTESYIDLLAPDEPGVYGLYEGQETIYYGSSDDSIRSRLQDHLNGHEGQRTQAATHFGMEATPYPVTREGELLREHRARYGRLPRCNDGLR